ncbi:MAG: hypothetical protein SF182_06520 [Deltaproteobacteria bacterium]|nr:hypothetical protein [Deltaproteobacteria bacterium]
MTMPPEEQLDATVVARFAADRGAADAARLSQAVLRRSAPLLAVRARQAYRRRLLRTLALALLPLPLVLAAETLLLEWLWQLAAAWLPSGVALTLVGSYAMAALVGLGLTYAAIPLLLAPRLRTAGDGSEEGVS